MEIFSADWVLPVGEAPIENGAVAFEGGRVTAVGPAADIGPATRRFDAAAIVPGFVNAHSHTEYAVYAGFGDGLDFGPWIELHVERKDRIAFEEMLAIARFGVAQCLASGITTIGDASYSGAAAQACAELGLRATIYLEGFGRRSTLGDRFRDRRARVEQHIGGRVRLGVSPHAPYTATAEAYRLCFELGLPIATHFAESAAEQEWLVSGTGAWGAYGELLVPPTGTTGIRMLAGEGLLGPQMIAAHCVAVDDEEIELLAASDIAVAHCPRSNALLGCGVAPLRKLLDAGIRVGLGTDGISSTPSHDMFDELRAAIMGARAREQRADALGAAEALELATLGSARALGMAEEVGSLAPGKQADLAVVSLAESPYFPWEDPAAAVVFGGSPERVILTLVDGEVRYEKGVTEWPELIAAAQNARRRLLGAAPVAGPA